MSTRLPSPVSFGWSDYFDDWEHQFHSCSDDSPPPAYIDDDDTTATPPTVEMPEKNYLVQFDSRVSIREYSVCLGDHPWTPEFPLSLDWSYRDAHGQLSDHCKPLTRLTAWERRQRLQTVTGMAYGEWPQPEHCDLRYSRSASNMIGKFVQATPSMNR